MSKYNPQIYTSCCPAQIYGEMRGKIAYFRSRWGEWQFGVGDTKHDAAEVAFQEKEGFSMSGRHETDGYPEAKECLPLFRKCCERYLEEVSQ